jgi:hypothetical protein
MDPNIKLVLKDMAKLCVEIKEGFIGQEAAFSKRLDEVVVTDQHYDTRVDSLEEVVTTFTMTLAEWRPEVDSSITTIKLELSKLNKFFDHNAKAPPHPVWRPIARVSGRVNTSRQQGQRP